ncbi:hypothetical protein JOS77_03480 [Chromobacterium haemolyticum]|nr:hypothetical protein JOS77_03480 [Chromobacterium haemolyticum]
MSHATSLSGVAQQLAAGCGVTAGAFVLQGVSGMQGHAVLTVVDFAWAFAIMGALTMLSSLMFATLDPRAGEKLASR